MRVFIPTARWLSARVKPSQSALIKLGTGYGGWVIAEPLPGADKRYALLCGAGEDVSFDISLQQSIDINCVIIDPTPRAIDHWQSLLESINSDEPLAINSSPTDFYDLIGVDFSKIHYAPYAVWIRNEDLKFWSPRNPKHVSFSAANIQNTNDYVLVPGKTLEALSPVPANDVEIVKLDVEGIGSLILSWMIQSNFLPRQILVEFEECIFPSLRRDQDVKRNVRALEGLGYDLVHFDGIANATFLRIEQAD
ncbi:MAG: hypothetical protein MH112_00010 [Phenylobacterium sp.]|uniref:hypothetical protein n=1 Tax=Phenylobacterium sp. TaxID=1871053 RepID=UPI0025E97113|nr:hypothetical protein [Phenylobacterium sp.]MCG9914728.1 hypothetical protein [Phenylobacterium sp.]